MINPDVLLWHPSRIERQPDTAAGHKRRLSSQRRTSGCCGGLRGNPGAMSLTDPSPDGHRPADTPEQPADPAASRCTHLQKDTSNQCRYQILGEHHNKSSEKENQKNLKPSQNPGEHQHPYRPQGNMEPLPELGEHGKRRCCC